MNVVKTLVFGVGLGVFDDTVHAESLGMPFGNAAEESDDLVGVLCAVELVLVIGLVEVGFDLGWVDWIVIFSAFIATHANE